MGQIANNAGRRDANRSQTHQAWRHAAPALPVVPFHNQPVPESVRKHRASIRLAAKKSGPMYTPKKA